MSVTGGTTTGKIRILIADDHEMVLDAFAIYLSSASDIEVTTAKTLEEALKHITATEPFDVVLLDLNMPGMNGVSGLCRAIRINGGKPVAIITGNPTPLMLDEIMNAGSSGIVLKTNGIRTLANAIRFMHAGEHYMPLELVRERHNDGRTTKNGRLSDKEMIVLSYLAEGKQNKEIANDLKLTEPTIKMHVSSICKKLSATNRTHAVILARDLGLN
jgi:DNA-binding NarL/FixJ family response regulator